MFVTIGGKNYQGAELKLHEQWDFTIYKNDIAILKLAGKNMFFSIFRLSSLLF